MQLYDYFYITMLTAFLTVFFGRTFVLHMKKEKVFALGIGKKSLQAFVELSFFPAFLLWVIAALSRSLHLDVESHGSIVGIMVW